MPGGTVILLLLDLSLGGTILGLIGIAFSQHA
jgi:hypothetical protein